jgi:serine protease Do
MKKAQVYIIIILILAAAVVAAGRAGYLGWKNYQAGVNRNFNDKIALLQKQISGLQQQVSKLTNNPPQAAPPPQEIINREVIREQSQDQLLTDAVAKTAPAVVSIVISKDVPQLQVVYTNPFGDDPFFKDFGFQVPTYKQIGTQKQKVGAGTGFLITSDGYIVTNRHVVEDAAADYTVLLSNGKQLPAKVVYKDSKLDTAIIKVDGSNFATVALGDSSGLKLGQAVIAIGNALGEYNNSVSTGIISGLGRTVQASDPQGNTETLSGVIQTDAAINPGNSGGPLLTLQGQVIGINVATVQGSSNISFSIPINMVKEIINTVTKK